jgi:hypothetical protein
MGLVADSVADYVAVLEAANIVVTTDPRNVRPPCTFVDSPTIRSLSSEIVELVIPVVLLAPPPGNADAMAALLALVDDVMDASTPASTITGDPGLYSIGGQDMPAYTLRVTVAYRKDN